MAVLDLDGVAEILAQDVDVWLEVVATLAQISIGDERVLRTSLETSSHVKWLLHGGFGADMSVWCHQFKSQEEALQKAYATTLHDHRYPFVSVVLRGGYTFENCVVEGERIALSTAARRSYLPGDCNVVPLHVAHRMIDVMPGTLTVVVQGTAKRRRSCTYETGTGEVRQRFPDLAVRLEELAATLQRN